MLSYAWVATFLPNFEYWRLLSLIESGTNPNLTKIKHVAESLDCKNGAIGLKLSI